MNFLFLGHGSGVYCMVIMEQHGLGPVGLESRCYEYCSLERRICSPQALCMDEGEGARLEGYGLILIHMSRR